jgi:hypothetical protein
VPVCLCQCGCISTPTSFQSSDSPRGFRSLLVCLQRCCWMAAEQSPFDTRRCCTFSYVKKIGGKGKRGRAEQKQNKQGNSCQNDVTSASLASSCRHRRCRCRFGRFGATSMAWQYCTGTHLPSNANMSASAGFCGGGGGGAFCAFCRRLAAPPAPPSRTTRPTSSRGLAQTPCPLGSVQHLVKGTNAARVMQQPGDGIGLRACWYTSLSSMQGPHLRIGHSSVWQYANIRNDHGSRLRGFEVEI